MRTVFIKGHKIEYYPETGSIGGDGIHIWDQDELTIILIEELYKAQTSTFTCPDCGYKVMYKEFVGE